MGCHRSLPGSAGLLLPALVLLGLAAPVAAGSGPANVPPGRTPVLSTPQGQIRGVVRNGASEYRGIPYAVRPERWSSPQPFAAWQGLRDAADFGPACPQLARFRLTEASSEEDCLTLNVSRPPVLPPGRRLPVLVWIHGGAFVGGSANLYRLDALAREGLVVVAANYRTGVLGFMPHPALDPATNGNLGLLDQREALRWVQRNIAAFGGDPTNVTLAGESAGAGSICMHLAAPELSRGLFHRAILISGGCLQPLPTVEDYGKLGATVARSVGCPQSTRPELLACLRARPLQDLLQAGDFATRGKTMTFGPSIGARLATPRSMAEALVEGRIHDVPLLMGGARDEMRLYIGYEQQSPDPITATNYPERLSGYFATDAGPLDAGRRQRLLARYPLQDPLRAPETLGSVISHYNPRVGINHCLYLHTASRMGRRFSGPIHVFEFADPHALVLGVGIAATPDPGMEFGAVHSSALNYLFPHFANTSRSDGPDLLPQSLPLAGQMRQMVASFARRGVPSAAGLPPWPGYNGGRTVMRLMPGQTSLYDASEYHDCTFWRQLFPAELS